MNEFVLNHMVHFRASRQRLLLAAQNMSLLCYPEAGMNLDWDLTYIIDGRLFNFLLRLLWCRNYAGMTTLEHSLPIPVLYDDILKLYAYSGTAATPTHVVNYGGTWGEEYVWATEDLPHDKK
jgi:hypothetical protein